jgi:hypothetical protein
MPARRAAAAPPSTSAAPQRLTRSRAASQGVAMPTQYTTPPDIARRRKPSRSVEIEEEHDTEQVERESSPLERKAHISFLSDLGTPDGESTPVSHLAYDLPSKNANELISPFVSKSAAFSSPLPAPTPSEPWFDLENTPAKTPTAITLRRPSPISAMPADAPSSKKRRHSESPEPASPASDESDSYQGPVLITYTPKPLTDSEFNRQKRIRTHMSNNLRERQTYEINIQRVMDKHRQDKVDSESEQETTKRNEINESSQSLHVSWSSSSFPF